MCAVLALLAVAVRHEDLFVGKLELSNDRGWTEASVQHDGNADFLVCVTAQCLADVLEGGALGVFSNFQTASAFEGYFLVFLVPLVVRAEETTIIFNYLIKKKFF